ncbi:hypothetical protein D3C76_1049180 [compost metagenome]
MCQQGSPLPQQQGAAPPAQQTEEEGDGAEEDHPGHLSGAKPQGGVEPIAYRRAGEQRKAQGVGEGVGDEGGHPHLRQGQSLVQHLQGQQIVAAEAAIAEQGEQQGGPQLRQGLRPDGQADVVPVPQVGQMIEDGQGRPQQQQAAQGAYPDQQLTPHSRFLSKSEMTTLPWDGEQGPRGACT